MENDDDVFGLNSLFFLLTANIEANFKIVNYKYHFSIRIKPNNYEISSNH